MIDYIRKFLEKQEAEKEDDEVYVNQIVKQLIIDGILDESGRNMK